MSFFKKLKNKLFKSSSKLDEGLDAIVSDGGVEETVEVEVPASVPDTAALEAEAERERLAAEAEKRAAEEQAAQEQAAQEKAAEDARRAEEQRAQEAEAARRAAEAEAEATAEALAEAQAQAEAEAKAQAEAEQARLAAEASASQAAAEEAARKAAQDAANAKAAQDAKAAAALAEAKAAEERAAAEAEAARQAAAQAEAEAQEKAQAEADAKAAEQAKQAQEAEDEAARALEQAKANVAADLSAPAAAALLAGDDTAEEPAKKSGLIGRLIGRKEAKTVLRRELDDDMLEALEELLRVTANLAEGRLGKKLSTQEIKELLASEITTIMEPVAKPMPLYPKRPQVVLVVGVNGSGKTTTIGKLASQFKAAGKSVVIAAGDTFRAAAVEQLQVWGDRAGVPVLTAPEGSDPASLAFDAMTKAEESGADLLMIDTAGRLQNRADLMEELAKIVRVIRKKDETAPHNTLLVLDATTGQNALNHAG